MHRILTLWLAFVLCVAANAQGLNVKGHLAGVDGIASPLADGASSDGTSSDGASSGSPSPAVYDLSGRRVLPGRQGHGSIIVQPGQNPRIAK